MKNCESVCGAGSGAVDDGLALVDRLWREFDGNPVRRSLVSPLPPSEEVGSQSRRQIVSSPLRVTTNRSRSTASKKAFDALPNYESSCSSMAIASTLGSHESVEPTASAPSMSIFRRETRLVLDRSMISSIAMSDNSVFTGGLNGRIYAWSVDGHTHGPVDALEGELEIAAKPRPGRDRSPGSLATHLPQR